jgi:hypothetical protein
MRAIFPEFESLSTHHQFGGDGGGDKKKKKHTKTRDITYILFYFIFFWNRKNTALEKPVG